MHGSNVGARAFSVLANYPLGDADSFVRHMNMSPEVSGISRPLSRDDPVALYERSVGVRQRLKVGARIDPPELPLGRRARTPLTPVAIYRR